MTVPSIPSVPTSHRGERPHSLIIFAPSGDKNIKLGVSKSDETQLSQLFKLNRFTAKEPGLTYAVTPRSLIFIDANDIPAHVCRELVLPSWTPMYARPLYYLTNMRPDSQPNVYIIVSFRTDGPIQYFPVICEFRPTDRKGSVGQLMARIRECAHCEIMPQRLWFRTSAVRMSEQADRVIERARAEDLVCECAITDEAQQVLQQRIYVVQEIIETECSYVSGLRELIDVYEPRLSKLCNGNSQIGDLRVVFGDIPGICNTHQVFLDQLKAAAAGPGQCVAAPFLEMMPVFQVVKPFMAYAQDRQKIVDKLEQNSMIRGELRRIVEGEHHPELNLLLAAPFQRMPRYLLFLDQLRKVTPPHHPDWDLLQLGLTEIRKMTQKVNRDMVPKDLM